MQLVTLHKPINRKELSKMSNKMFGNLVKAVVDVKEEIMMIDAGLHADEEQALLSQGSQQENLWGINLYSENRSDNFIEFDSLINIRPFQNNQTRGIDDQKLQKRIREVVLKLVK